MPRAFARLLLLLPCLPFLSGTPAAAQEAQDTGHRGQVGVHAQVGMGYRLLLPYEGEFCGEAGKSVCAEGSPMFLELGLSYGLSRMVDLVADLRVGIEKDFVPRNGTEEDAPRSFVFAPGVKLFLDDEGRLKFFSTLQVAFDFTDFSASVDQATDYGIRNVNGIEFDINRHVGVYLHFGETVGFARWLRFEMDGGLGVEARFP